MKNIAKHYDEDIWEIPQIEEDIWITFKGEKIPISKMTNLHIINTIKCWLGIGLTKLPKGYLGGKNKWLKLFTNELLKREKAKNERAIKRINKTVSR